MHIRAFAASLVGALSVFSIAPAIASADALSVSCSGTPGVGSIVWAALPVGGVMPYEYQWGNGSTSSSQTVAYAAGTYAMNIQVTDASSTIATSTCSATVSAAPVITAFTATPASITVGSTTMLSWNVTGAVSLSLSGVGSVSGTSTVLAPATTTTYTLTATNSGGTASSSLVVTVSASTGTTSGVLAQIQALLAQIQALKAQIAQLVSGSIGNGTGSTTPPVINGARVCLDDDSDHGEGESGDDIRSIQQLLASDPSIYPEGVVSGFYGPLTKKAIQRYQSKFGVSATGFFGPQTRALFKSHCGEGLVRFTTGSTTVALPPGQLKKMEDHNSTSSDSGKNKDKNKDKNKGNDRFDD